MGVRAEIDVASLIQEIHKVLCPKCRKKLEKLELPVVQKIKVMDLTKKP